MRVTERHDTEPGEHRCDSVSALALLHEGGDGGEDVFFIDTEFARLLEVVGKDVEEKLRVGGSVDVTVGGLVHELEKFFCVD